MTWHCIKIGLEDESPIGARAAPIRPVDNKGLFDDRADMFDQVLINKITELGSSTYERLSVILGISSVVAEVSVNRLQAQDKLSIIPCKFCNNCGFINEEHIGVCVHCGHNLSDALHGFSQGTVIW